MVTSWVFAMNKRNLVWIASACLLVVTANMSAFGQIRESARLAVDVVHLKNQKQIRGFVLSAKTNEDVSIAVSKGWFEREDQAAYLKAEVSAKQESAKARLQLRDRLKILLNDPAQMRDGAFGFLVRSELERIESEIANPPDHEIQFLVLRVKSTTVSSLNIATDANRKIAVWSWHERLSDVESRKPSSLANELKLKKIDATTAPPDLSSRFYVASEGDELWTIRLAIVSYRLDKAIEFQGSGEVMLLVGGERPPDFASLIGQMMPSQLNSLVQELTGVSKKPPDFKSEEAEWTKSAVSQAEKRNAAYFRATNVRTESLGNAAIVESIFMVKLASGQWTAAWKTSVTQLASEQNGDAIQRITNDPQVKAIQAQFEAFGGAEVSLDTAIRVGAATMTAQRNVNDEFVRFSELYIKQLNSPPIQLPSK